MRRIITFLLLAILCFSLCACDGTDFVDNDNTQSVSVNTGKEENSNDIQDSNNSVDDDESSEAVHTHNWINATCTAPKTCSCGAKEGAANGHTWQNATCSQPKTCTVCGTTSGLTTGHHFSDGKCTLCGKDDPDYVRVTMVWIPTKGGTKYHSKSSCSNMDNPEKVTKSQAESLGFTPCKRCY